MKKGRLSFKNWITGALVGAGAAVLASVGQAVEQGLINHEHININIGAVGGAAVGGLLTYAGYKRQKDDIQTSINILKNNGFKEPEKKDQSPELPKLR